MIALTPTQQEALCAGHCPLCLSSFLIPGPRGGCSRNILCASCEAEFCASLVVSQLLAECCDLGRQKEVYGIDRPAFNADPLCAGHKPTYVFAEENQIRADALRFAADIVEQAAAGGTGGTVAMLRKAAVTYEHLAKAELGE